MRIKKEPSDISNNKLLNFILDKPRKLAHIERYSTFQLVGHETVAEHSYFVALYARVLCAYVKYPVNLQLVMERALFHDIEEAVSGDIVHAFKYSGQLREELDRINNQTIKKVFYEIKGKDYYINVWKSAKDSSIEGQIIELADNLSVLSFAIEELRLGNSYMKIVIDNTLEILREISESTYFGFLESLIEEIKRKGLNE